jgi:uncharacterized membrane protein
MPMKIPTIVPWRAGDQKQKPEDIAAKSVPPAAPAALPIETAPLDTLLDGPAVSDAADAVKALPEKAKPLSIPVATIARERSTRAPVALAGPILPEPQKAAALTERVEAKDDPKPSMSSTEAIAADAMPPPTRDHVGTLAVNMIKGQAASLRARLPSPDAARSVFGRARTLLTPNQQQSPPSSAPLESSSAAAAPTVDAPARSRLALPKLSTGSLSLPTKIKRPTIPVWVWSAWRVTKRVLSRPASSRIRLGWLTWVVAFIAAAIVHIVATFAVPVFSSGESALARRLFPLALLGSQSAYAMLKRELPVNQMVILPPPKAREERLPYFSPDMRYAMCRFDISAGPLAVQALLPDRGWSLAIHTPNGDNPYVVPAPVTRALEVSFTLVPTSDRLFNLAPGVRRLNTDATQVSINVREGLIVIRAPLAGVAFDAAAAEALAKAACTPIRQ